MTVSQIRRIDLLGEHDGPRSGSIKRHNLINRLLNKIKTVPGQWVSGDTRDEGLNRQTREIIDKTCQSCLPTYCQPDEVVHRSLPTVVRTGEWPFEPGSKAFEQRKSANAFKGFEVAGANVHREALGSAVESKEMPKVHTRVNDSTIVSQKGRISYSIDIKADGDNYIQRWTGKWPFEPDSVEELQDCEYNNRNFQSVLFGGLEDVVLNRNMTLSCLPFDPGPHKTQERK